ncbi:MAG TPA: hypothetical protein PJ982_13105 [Lacipirellulaceae bacterium]|nr:hypothetical protein [Lacipirellulaceae bacterium]
MLLLALGQFDADREVYFLRFGALELWQDYAALCALPVSLVGYVAGNLLGRPKP